MKHTLISIFACALLGACAHTAKHYDAPDSTQLRAAAGKLNQKVTEAKATTARASAAVTAAKVSIDIETKQIADLSPRVDNLLRLSPAELRPEVQALKLEIAAHSATHEESVAHLGVAKSEMGALTGQLEEATAAKNDVAKYGPEYFAGVDKIVAALNESETARAKDSKALLWYRLHWWGAWIVAGLGIVACVLLAFLKTTGRLAITAKQIAS